MPTDTADSPLRAWILAPASAHELRIWGLTPEERLHRSLVNSCCNAVERIGADGTPPARGTGVRLLFRGDLIFEDAGKLKHQIGDDIAAIRSVLD